MNDCYWCGEPVPECDLDEHVLVVHPDRVGPLSPARVEAIATHRSAYDLTCEEGR